MAGDGQPNIPSWQRAAPPIAQRAETKDKPTPNASNNTAPAMVRQEQDTESHAVISDPNASQMGWLEDNASDFLKHKKVARAPVEKKLEFLEGKGVSREVGRQLMASESGGEAEDEIETVKETSTHVETAPAPAPSAAPVATPAPSPPQVAPIITYPEFLLHSTKRPPLVTTEALQKTAYTAAGLAAGMYCLAKLVLDPMQEALTEARHDFLEHATDKLRTLTERVTPLVSALPAPKTSPTIDEATTDVDRKSEAGYSTDGGDPTELYHRDMGTQTTPNLSRRNSLSSTSDGAATPTDLITSHENRLKSITSQLSAYASLTSSEGMHAEDIMSTQLQSLTEYLNEMRYQNPYISYRAPGGAGGQDKDDEIEKVRADIRGIKGVLLSTRNFPRGGYR